MLAASANAEEAGARYSTDPSQQIKSRTPTRPGKVAPSRINGDDERSRYGF
jgi:hypothetical protein